MVRFEKTKMKFVDLGQRKNMVDTKVNLSTQEIELYN